MMTLIVPEYVLAQRNAKKKAEEEAKKLKLTERIPQPTGWRILVMPYMGKEKTDGGVYVPDPVREREARATVTAFVAKSGRLLIKISINLEKTELGVRKAIGFVLVAMQVHDFK